MKTRLLPDDVVALDVDPEATDAVLLDAVVDHWHQSLMASDERVVILSSLGVSVAVAERLRIGVSDRTLGNRLPDRQWKAGLVLRSRLTDFGILRESGHEAFRGCLTVPITDPVGTVVGVFGRRTDRTRAEVWAGGLPGGVFNERAATTCSEVIVVGSMPDALAVFGAGHEAVVGPGRPGGLKRSDLRLLVRGVMRRCVLVGDGLSVLAERIAAEGVECAIVSPGAPLAALLRHADDRPDALKTLLDTARAVTRAGAQQPASAVAPTEPPTPPAVDDEVGLQVSGDTTELHVSMGTHHWRVRGADRNKTPDSLRVSLAVTDEGHGAFHLDTLDLCQAKARAAFTDAAAAELHTDVTSLRRELAEVLFATEAALAARETAVPRPAMTEAERADAMALLEDPRLAERVVEDLGWLGVVGEETNLLVAYLATISRKAERPFGVVVQSSTAAGKSTLADAVCQLVPEEDLASYSAITGQALYYVGATDLARKVLAVAEEQGAARASYALKLLVTEGRLSIASTGKDTVTGKLRTRTYEVAGPVALVLTTTATDIDPELANRLVVLGVDEDQAQTRAIHLAQRRAATLDGLVARVGRERVVGRHRNAQRLLEALPVVIPDAEALVFPDTATRHRRDHQKLLSLICASALLHQHQRTIGTVEVESRSVRYVEATGDDVALGLRLADRVLARAGDDLAPQTRRLLAAAQAHVGAVVVADGVDAATVA
ncbi:MAG: DNA primase, partial [Acidimicrobiales bacterium]